jgi:hypothetical protein
MTWHYLQYVVGLRRLGYDVFFIEDSSDYPCCYNPATHVTDCDPSYGLKYAKDVFKRVDLGDRWAYHDAHSNCWHGPCADSALDLIKSADMLINVSGSNRLRPWTLAVPKRVLVDTDPAFMQIRHLTDPDKRTRADQHTDYFSFGENFGQPECRIPDDGFPWKPTRQPVVMDAWPLKPAPENGRFTTVMQWDSYQVREYRGKAYGMKSLSFRDFIELPARVGGMLEVALGSPDAPRPMLREKGWHLCDPLKITETPWSYQAYIQKSKAEFSVAKHGYVISQSGWFSERSAAYLASGRPVVTQDTGFSQWMETGAGALRFGHVDEAVDAIEQVISRYDFHCKQARDIAGEYFDYRKVLSNLIDDAMSSTANRLEQNDSK